MNHGEHGENGSLKSFYGYKETFQKETTWMPVPRDLKFVHTDNPYEDDDYGVYVDHEGNEITDMGERYEETGPGKSDYQFTRELAHAAYSHTYPATYPTHGLEALSAVASDQYSYAPPPAPMTQPEQPQQQQSPTASHEQNSSSASQNLHYILNPTSAGASNNSNIDPRLHGDAAVPHSSPQNVSIAPWFNGQIAYNPQASSLAAIEAQLSSELAND